MKTHYRFKHTPFGLRISQGVFQTKIDQTFERCDGVVGIADDIDEHNCNMHTMLKQCIDNGLNLNPDKCFVKQVKINFYGVVCGQGGIQPDPCKVSAPLANYQQLQTFLGLASDMGPFIANLSMLTAPLRELLKASE